MKTLNTYSNAINYLSYINIVTVLLNIRQWMRHSTVQTTQN